MSKNRKQFAKTELRSLNEIKNLTGRAKTNAIKMYMLTSGRTYSSIASKLHRLTNNSSKAAIRSIRPISTISMDRELRFNIKSLSINNNQIVIKY